MAIGSGPFASALEFCSDLDTHALISSKHSVHTGATRRTFSIYTSHTHVQHQQFDHCRSRRWMSFEPGRGCLWDTRRAVVRCKHTGIELALQRGEAGGE